MLLWFSDGFEPRAGIDLACLEARSGEEVSHDNVFSSVLGLMDVKTELYNAALDLTAACRTAEGRIHHQAVPATPADDRVLSTRG